jgi:hypothetical protein
MLPPILNGWPLIRQSHHRRVPHISAQPRCGFAGRLGPAQTSTPSTQLILPANPTNPTLEFQPGFAMVHNARDLSPTQKSLLEALLGRSLSEEEAISVRVTEPTVPPAWLASSWADRPRHRRQHPHRRRDRGRNRRRPPRQAHPRLTKALPPPKIPGRSVTPNHIQLT